MLQRGLKFTAFLVVAVIVLFQSHELFLAYFVFCALLLISALHFLEDPKPHLFVAAIAVTAIIYFFHLVQHPVPEMGFLGLAQVLFAGLFVYYRRYWSSLIRVETRQCEIARESLQVLKQKHQSRLESLHHLEKQVGGLLDLFEIARDFNDTLSFEGIAAILKEKVMPELPFNQMQLILLEKNETENVVQRVLCINERGVQDSQGSEILTPKDLQLMQTVKETQKMLQKDEGLAFPIFIDGELRANLLVAGPNPDDLAKFEVLAAYLALQVKKVRLYETVKELSIQDGLTGVFVRRHFVERLDEELKRSLKYELPLAVLMLDIDHFKRYNDAHGHLAGDATLKQVATLLRENLRRVDIVARYGGEEFVVVTPETRKIEANEVAERIRSNIARHNFKVYNDQTRVTVSIGVALFPDDIPDSFPKTDVASLAAELIHRADQALYRAKEEGRNRVVFFKDL
jgi:diguanylate cyclase (GGDEF)-like protein